MSKLKSLYKKDKAITLEEWMDKLQKLKTNKLNEIVSTLFKIREIFKAMEDTSSNIGELEKVKIMYNSLPLYAKFFIHPTKDYTSERFFNEINNIVTFKLYAGDSKLIEENLDKYFVHDRTQDNENETSINLISKYTNRKIKNKNNFKYKHKTHNNKYCYICEKKGHTTKECRYNKKRKHYSNEESSSESENENKNKQKQNNKANNMGKSLNFIAAENYDDNNDFDANVDFNDIREMF